MLNLPCSARAASALLIVPSLDLVIHKMGGNNGQYHAVGLWRVAPPFYQHGDSADIRSFP